MRHAGTRLYAPQLAISPTTYCGTCWIPFVNFCILAVVQFSGRAGGFEIACVGSIPYGRESANL